MPDTQAAERRTWNSKPSEDTRVTNGEGVPLTAMVVSSVRRTSQNSGQKWLPSGNFSRAKEKREEEREKRVCQLEAAERVVTHRSSGEAGC